MTLAAALADDAPRDAALVNAALFPLTGANPTDLGLAAILDEIRFHGGSVAETIDPAQISRLEGGTGEIAKRIAAELPAGTIRFGAKVESVVDNGSSVTVSGGFGHIVARKTILALPLNVLKHIDFSPVLPSSISALISQGHAGRTAKFWALATGDSMPEECLITGHPFSLTYAKPVKAGQFLICAQALIDDVKDTSETSLKALFAGLYPNHTITDVAMHDWASDPLALGSWHSARPGQSAAMALMRHPFGNLVFCGGDFSDPWSGWIEGAVLSGAKAAQAFS